MRKEPAFFVGRAGFPNEILTLIIILKLFVNLFFGFVNRVRTERRTMTGTEALDIGREALWTTVMMAGPAMIVGLLVGVGIALFQALTQVQEMTLVFVPKIVAIFIALLLFLPMMGGLIAVFAQDTFARIASM